MNNQIDKLADFIMREVDGEPSESEGAGDCAIRIIKTQKEEIGRLSRKVRLEIDAAQGQPSFTVCDPFGVILAKAYNCKDGVVVSASAGCFRLPVGLRTMDEQVGKVTEVPKIDGFNVTGGADDVPDNDFLERLPSQPLGDED